MFSRHQSSNIVDVIIGRELSQRPISNSIAERIIISKFQRNKQVYYSQIKDSSVFGIEFSNDYQILLSSHSDGIIRGHDIRTHQLFFTTPAFHTDACNGCTFVNSNTFASFSDDCHVLLWDFRNTKRTMKALVGHKGWVKNVNVYPGGTKLLTSGTDQTIRIFDINSPEECINEPPLMVFDGLCRVKLSSSGEFLVFTTLKTTVFQIQNLDLGNIASDIKNYLMSFANGKSFPFSEKRNRIKLVHYVPFHKICTGHSLDIHPDELCCLVRHTRSESDMDSQVEVNPSTSSPEWLSVYDVESDRNYKPPKDPSTSDEQPSSGASLNLNSCNKRNILHELWGEGLPPEEQLRLWRRTKLSQKIENGLVRNANQTRARLNMLYSSWIDEYTDSGMTPQDLNDAAYFRSSDAVASGIIKEASFNSNGKLILNPTKSGFEILAFDPKLTSYSKSATNNGTNVPCKATELTVLKDCLMDKDAHCLCVKFSPDDTTIAAGDMKGNVSWFSPIAS